MFTQLTPRKANAIRAVIATAFALAHWGAVLAFAITPRPDLFAMASQGIAACLWLGYTLWLTRPQYKK